MQQNSGRSRLIFASAAAVLAISACGSSDGGAAEGSSPSTEPASTSPSTSSTGWCDFVDESDVVDEILESLGSGSADLEGGLNQVEQFTERLVDEAPPEVAEAAGVVAENTLRLVDALRDADFEILDADLAFLSDTEIEARLDAATDELEKFTQSECGRTFSADGASDPGEVPSDSESGDEGLGDDEFDLGDGTIREQIVTQLESLGLTASESECIAENLDFSDPAVQSGDVAAMLSVFEVCDIGLERLTELGG